MPRGFADQANELWREGQFEDLEELCRANRSTLARVVSYVARHRQSPIADVSAGAGDVAARDLRRHLQRAYPLNVVATLSPLLGLLGTVIGMIESFGRFQAFGEEGDPSVFAGSISKALITTATGLIIAIPSLGFYHWYRSRTNNYGVALEEQSSELISDWLMKKE